MIGYDMQGRLNNPVYRTKKVVVGWGRMNKQSSVGRGRMYDR